MALWVPANGRNEASHCWTTEMTRCFAPDPSCCMRWRICRHWLGAIFAFGPSVQGTNEDQIKPCFCSSVSSAFRCALVPHHGEIAVARSLVSLPTTPLSMRLSIGIHGVLRWPRSQLQVGRCHTNEHAVLRSRKRFLSLCVRTITIGRSFSSVRRLTG